MSARIESGRCRSALTSSVKILGGVLVLHDMAHLSSDQVILYSAGGKDAVLMFKDFCKDSLDLLTQQNRGCASHMVTSEYNCGVVNDDE